jgi:WS/DGAT/MGAT family acyltransferase
VPPERVWPWLVQMGWHRGGWYTAGWVDRLLFPANWPSATHLVPELQRPLEVGDHVPDGPPDTAWFVVAHVDPPHLLVLHSTTHLPAAWRARLRASIDWTWTFTLADTDDGGTRLLLRVRGRTRPWWLTAAYVAGLVPADYIMAHSMLAGISRRCDGRVPSPRSPIAKQPSARGFTCRPSGTASCLAAFHRGAEPADDGHEGAMTMRRFASRYQRLSVQDAGFLDLEHAGLPQHVAILAVAEGGPLLDPDGRLRLDAVRRELGGRLGLVPRLRQRVLCPRVGQGLPLWVDDPAFDLANHVRVVQVPAPGRERELLGLCDELCLRLLDRARPLWELWLVRGLANGRVGLVLKLHHSLADGLAAVQIAGVLLDGTVNGGGPAASWLPRQAPSGWALAADNLRGRGATLAAVLARLRHPRELAARAVVVAGGARMAAGGRRHRRRSLLRRPVGGRRRLAVVRARLAVVKAVAHGHAATVNDVLLAAVAGGLRSLLVTRGVPVDGLIVSASVPVSLRAQADTAALGNKVGLMVVPLPVGEPDPVQRLRHITGATTERKHRPEVVASLRPVGSLTILRALNRYSRHQRIVDVFVTNVAGPQLPLYLLGARLLEAFPVVQVAGNVPLSVAVLSYDGRLNIGIQSDPDGCPDLEVFADGLRRSLEELDAATPPSRTEPERPASINSSASAWVEEQRTCNRCRSG